MPIIVEVNPISGPSIDVFTNIAYVPEVQLQGPQGPTGGITANVVTKTAAYTAAVGDLVQANAATAGFTVTLPTNPILGALVSVKKIDATINTVTIAPAAGGTIDGDPNATTTTRWAGAVFEHVGSNAWSIISQMTSYGPPLNAFGDYVPKVGASIISPPNASSVPVILRGFASQTADLQQWQDSAGAVTAAMNPGGKLRVGPEGALVRRSDGVTSWASIKYNSAGLISFVTDTDVQLSVAASKYQSPATNELILTSSTANGWQFATLNAAYKALTVRGAVSQTADLQQWQNSAGTVLSRVMRDGRLSLDFGAPIDATVDVALAVRPRLLTPGSVGIAIQGVAAQTADLQQWRDSGGTVLSRVTAAGELQVPGVKDIAGAVPIIVGATTRGTFNATGLVVVGRVSITEDNPATTCLSVTAANVQTADMQTWKSAGGDVGQRINKDGYNINKKTAAPADADLVANELATWLDATTLATKVMFKAKDSLGIVRTGSIALS